MILHTSQANIQSKKQCAIDSFATLHRRQCGSVCSPQLSILSRVGHLFLTINHTRNICFCIPPENYTSLCQATVGMGGRRRLYIAPVWNFERSWFPGHHSSSSRALFKVRVEIYDKTSNCWSERAFGMIQASFSYSSASVEVAETGKCIEARVPR